LLEKEIGPVWIEGISSQKKNVGKEVEVGVWNGGNVRHFLSSGIL